MYPGVVVFEIRMGVPEIHCTPGPMPRAARGVWAPAGMAGHAMAMAPEYICLHVPGGERAPRSASLQPPLLALVGHHACVGVCGW